jgi:hypothetical protein
VWLIAFIVIVVFFALVAVVVRQVREKNVDLILRSQAKRRRETHDGTRHVFFCFVDHYEPFWKGADEQTALERVHAWRAKYASAVDSYRDASGRPPQHTFFYPEEEYNARCIDMLAELCREGYGDVEIHLHHDRDTSDALRAKIVRFRDTLHERHGLLRKDPSGRTEYGFIHGNWTLDDSGVDGRWCGVRDEITILKETGCYADFTYPSAPHPTQPPMINQIYYATDDPLRPKSHHQGVEAAYGTPPSGDLLLVTGPLMINWGVRRFGIFPRLENGEIAATNAPSPERVRLWGQAQITVRGWPKWVFIKVHTHGTQDKNARLLLGDAIGPMYRNLLSHYDVPGRSVLHFVTAREVYDCIKALESADEAAIARIEAFQYSVT